NEVKDKACVVLDTNVLLVQYGIGAQTLSAIEKTYRGLIKEKRLIIPEKVAREFERNRALRHVELHKKLLYHKRTLPVQLGRYRLMENLAEYKGLREAEEQLSNSLTNYTKRLEAVIDHVRGWEWNDPVSVLYGQLFQAELIVDTAKPLDDIRAEH